MVIKVQAQQENFDRIFEHMGSMVDEMLNRNYFRSSKPDTWDPALNIYEAPDRFVICVELAGISREKIDVRLEGKLLHVRGFRHKPVIPDSPDDVSVHVMEIDSGRFHRKIPVPGDVNTADIQARYRNGYLWITMPRQALVEHGKGDDLADE